MSAAGEDDILPAVKYRCIDYAFTADCTLHLEDGTDMRREVKGKWSACRLRHLVGAPGFQRFEQIHRRSGPAQRLQSASDVVGGGWP